MRNKFICTDVIKIFLASSVKTILVSVVICTHLFMEHRHASFELWMHAHEIDLDCADLLAMLYVSIYYVPYKVWVHYVRYIVSQGIITVINLKLPSFVGNEMSLEHL